jgi:hypothetical protein
MASNGSYAFMQLCVDGHPGQHAWAYTRESQTYSYTIGV